MRSLVVAEVRGAATRRRWSAAMLLGWMLAGTLAVGRGEAQIVLDGTLGTEGPLKGPNYEIGAELGEQRGRNLFHSFETFNVHQGESATFSGPGVVENIIGRVTGGGESVIDGQVRSTIPEANLYLINPAGVVFGENAEVDVSGSFAVSTADYVALGDNGRFDAREPQSSSLSVAPPSAFGFVTEKPQGITVRGSRLELKPETTLTVVSGGIDVQGGSVSVPGGGVQLASVGGPGEVPVDVGGADGAAEEGDLSCATHRSGRRPAEWRTGERSTSGWETWWCERGVGCRATRRGAGAVATCESRPRSRSRSRGRTRSATVGW